MISRIRSLRLSLAAFLLLMPIFFGQVLLAADEQPNFLVILVDDLGYNDVGYNGSEVIKTPVIDNLAHNGVIFKNGYVTHPYCGPSRAGLITGRYQARFGMEINLTYSHYDLYAGLPLTEKTFAKRLQASGYHTGAIGKWHLGASRPFHPNQRGFDYFYGFLSGGHDYFPDTVSTHPNLVLPNGNPHYSANEGSYEPLIRNDKIGEFEEYLTTALSRDAARFVKESEKPFCLYLAYNAPHGPLEAPKENVQKYKHIKDYNRRMYAAMIDSLDEGIGMVVEALKESGKYNNTLIFFLSDNGGVQPKPNHENENWADNTPFRNGKGSMREGGSHVPFIAHWPAGIPKGSVYDYPISALDIAATLVALGKGDTSGNALDGVNLIPYVTGENRSAPHEAIYWRTNGNRAWCIRTPEAKFLLENHGATEPELYDMINDPYESNNIIDERPELRAKLAKMWNEWNANNENTFLLQSGSYQKRRLQMYKELYEELKAKGAKQPVHVIK